jgi:thioredoxin reductase (NADPH)
MTYDCIEIGTSPAGVSAALNLKIRDKSFLLVGDPKLSSKIEKAELVKNYPGFPDISGAVLKDHFQYHLMVMGIEVTDEMVTQVRKYGDTFAVTAGPEFYEARSIILATGVVLTKTLEGENDFVGRGVSYCATCDGGLYRGRHIAVISGNKRFEPEVEYLAGLAEKVEFYPNYLGPWFSADNVETHVVRLKAVKGEERVNALVTAEGEVPVDGVFILRDSMSLATLLPELEVEGGHLKVDRSMATSVPGVYACGDCTGKPYQYTKAVGEGNVAAHSVLDYLAEMDRKAN